ncbi:proline-, glutamic acid- and leucine-rich protein 1-like [Bufo bufo]|uniref:proline-, glutamic acid- and leucine-rich protein 1-like n=1 Tax=Bufo bufo TaxID=8384 RepID=UPI001ABE4B6B|nr:proline-, glutamic acid- and leucine-rich protein 1-like [Bufo bufo]
MRRILEMDNISDREEEEEEQVVEDEEVEEVVEEVVAEEEVEEVMEDEEAIEEVDEVVEEDQEGEMEVNNIDSTERTRPKRRWWTPRCLRRCSVRNSIKKSSSNRLTRFLRVLCCCFKADNRIRAL